ncbi:MAG: DNA mismatch repair endonuclease MutL [Pyrinomonadaceae bacterium]
MNKIKILSDNLANQIAAGEVVERPASVIKELIENALDAGARRLSVEVELGGRRLMRVTDDGTGMSRDDAILSFERHATSKIKNLEDLNKIATLGFRGEALASIASVAKVELVTKTLEDTAATRVYIEGGKLVDVKEIARPPGTTITVRDLFYNTPARRKFMRSEATENYYLTNILTHYALAHPEIAFALTNNGREIIRVSPAKDLRERAYQLFGAQLFESLLPVSGGREFVANISGFISAPRERRSTRDGQYFFINRRFVRDKVISGGLLEGFRSVLPHGVYPLAFLFLEIPFEELDVNVHPAKTEVRFRRPEAVKEVISEAIRGALRNAGILQIESKEIKLENQDLTIESDSEISLKNILHESQKTFQPTIDYTVKNSNQHLENENSNYQPIQQAESPLTENQPPNFEIQISSNDFEKSAQEKSHQLTVSGQQSAINSPFNSDCQITVGKREEDSELLTNTKNIASSFDSQSATSPIVDSAVKIPKSIEPKSLSFAKIRPIAQLHDSFIIATDNEGLLLIDQHVAHERILFDKFRQKESERKIESQNLLLPETFDLSPAQAIAFDQIEPELENLGFGVMRLSGRTIAVKSVPTDLPPSEVRNLLAEILDSFAADKRGHAKSTLRDSIAASLACKAAVKINMKLTLEKMQWLIDQLLTTSSPTTCPHGRPVILRLTMKDIERGFHRT